jgi:hypothetical protein
MVGAAARLSPQFRRRMRQLIGVGPLQEGRRYAPAEGLHQLFETLNRKNVEYVVLRWFEWLPDCADGDIDFLVADEKLPQFESLLNAGRQGIPCDLYSESGRPGYRYAGMPYLPPELARRILARRIIIPGPLSIPCAEDHFLSLAYHAVYQKGLRSGLRTSLRCEQPAILPIHDYHGTLSRLADELSLPVEISMEGVEEFLARRGWRPPAQVLKRLADHNPWLREHIRAGADSSSGASTPRMQAA